jgi:hypothetical protein
VSEANHPSSIQAWIPAFAGMTIRFEIATLASASPDSPTVIVELTYDGSVMELPVQSL